MRRTRVAPALLLLAGLFLTAGCAQPGEGNLSVQATDAPGNIDDFESLTVTIESIRVHAAGEGQEDADDTASSEDEMDDNETEDDGAGWITFQVNASAQEFDLTELLNGNTTTLLNVSLDAGRYTQIRLDVTGAIGQLKEGGSVEVATPSNALKIVKSFTIEEGKTTTFVADINVVKTGQGDYQLQPVVGKSKVMGPE